MSNMPTCSSLFVKRSTKKKTWTSGQPIIHKPQQTSSSTRNKQRPCSRNRWFQNPSLFARLPSGDRQGSCNYFSCFLLGDLMPELGPFSPSISAQSGTELDVMSEMSPNCTSSCSCSACLQARSRLAVVSRAFNVSSSDR